MSFPIIPTKKMTVSEFKELISNPNWSHTPISKITTSVKTTIKQSLFNSKTSDYTDDLTVNSYSGWAGVESALNGYVILATANIDCVQFRRDTLKEKLGLEKEWSFIGFGVTGFNVVDEKGLLMPRSAIIKMLPANFGRVGLTEKDAASVGIRVIDYDVCPFSNDEILLFEPTYGEHIRAKVSLCGSAIPDKEYMDTSLSWIALYLYRTPYGAYIGKRERGSWIDSSLELVEVEILENHSAIKEFFGQGNIAHNLYDSAGIVNCIEVDSRPAADSIIGFNSFTVERTNNVGLSFIGKLLTSCDDSINQLITSTEMRLYITAEGNFVCADIRSSRNNILDTRYQAKVYKEAKDVLLHYNKNDYSIVICNAAVAAIQLLQVCDLINLPRYIKNQDKVINLDMFLMLVNQDRWSRRLDINHIYDYHLDNIMAYDHSIDDYVLVAAEKKEAVRVCVGQVTLISTIGNFSIEQGSGFEYTENLTGSFNLIKDTSIPSVVINGFSVIDEYGLTISPQELIPYIPQVFSDYDIYPNDLIESIDMEHIDDSSDFKSIILTPKTCRFMMFNGIKIGEVKEEPSDLFSGRLVRNDDYIFALKLYKTADEHYVCVRQKREKYSNEIEKDEVIAVKDINEVKAFFGEGWLANSLYDNAGLSNIIK